MDQEKKKPKFYLHVSKISFTEDLVDRDGIYQLECYPDAVQNALRPSASCKVDHCTCNYI